MSAQQEIASAKDPGSSASIRKVAWTIAFGVLLNPLNSSMIAVALLQIGSVFEASLATVTWLITGFYLAGAIGLRWRGSWQICLEQKEYLLAALCSCWPAAC